MSEKKHIDRLFQEKFKDFEVAPPDELWGKIEAELQPEKKKRRVIPIWFRMGGVAAALIIGMLLTLPLFTGGDKDGDGIDTNTNKVVLDGAKQNKQDNNNNSIVPATDAENAVVTTSDATDDTTLNQNGQNGFGSHNNTATEQQGGNVSNTTNNNNSFINTDSPVITNRNNSSNNAVAYDNNTANKAGNNTNQTSNTDKPGSITNRNAVITENGMPATQQDANRAVAQQNNNSRTSGLGNDSGGVSPLNQERNNNDLIDTNRISNNGNDAGVAVNSQEQNQQNTNGAVSGNDTNGNTVGEENNLINIQEGENLLSNPIDAQNSELADATAETDTTAVDTEAENELEELFRKMQEEKDEDEAVADAVKNYKWNIKPQVAPLFYNSMSQGSPIDAQFASNSKNYDADMSYGVGIDYAITDRLSVRSGINTVNLSYSTNDIAYYASIDGGTNNVVAAGRAANIVVQTQGPNNGDVQGVITNGPGAGTAVTFASNIFSNQSFEGQMVQKMGYIEVPLEMSYKLLKSKFGINLIGGFSTLFLNDNNVSVVSNQGYSTEVGEASNVNNVNFSTNLGVGFKYNFWNSFEASFEPTFKYQVNTFSGSSGNFKPYFIGLYSGISFKF
ncbi:hypothetical protein GN157_16620 [Flavobacterium rakeshii]|uniref:Outer membrane beta-barrel protein n=1 Tax=Flavobacterium rakeshii TaxID=1038845 RepID=A0A6N8HI17_9FLAO|nr:outer membrane beta-barrel protein [Flavobacterium rakeshii]MUV05340.1 hypothetical protein [Flavobacterium rakeshii]